jgi:prepilin-type N-terminal cleavage/methylation domain-containing protein
MHKLSLGFTLIELSIVLVIIGLIVGGVLVGKDLIHSAEIQRTIKQKTDYETAVNTFRNKFNSLPGDTSKAVDFGLGTVGGTGDNGLGTGFVGDDRTQYMEIGNFWTHLYNAHLISDSFTPLSPADLGGVLYDHGPGVTSPKIAIGGQSLQGRPAGWEPYYRQYVPTNTIGWPTHSFIITSMIFEDENGVGVLTPFDAYSLDAKIDDGLPLSGKVQAFGDHTQTNGCCYFDSLLRTASSDYRFSTSQGGALPACIDDTTAPTRPTYNIVNAGAGQHPCGLAMGANF